MKTLIVSGAGPTKGQGHLLSCSGQLKMGVHRSYNITPPPSSTNVERLFSIRGLTATDHRAALSGEKLDQILFLRENALMANFKLGWE